MRARASQTWSASPTDANCLTTANWVGNAVPGALNPAASGLSNDLVTFNSAIFGTIGSASNPIANDASRDVSGFLFDTANVGAYTIGSVRRQRAVAFSHRQRSQEHHDERGR